MNPKDRMILEEYRRQRQDFTELGGLATDALRQSLTSYGIDTLALECRVKTEKSLAGKLERKGDKYRTLDDLTDILGARVICFFNDDVDRVGRVVEELFVVDWDNSVDKRALIKADSFGYLSLHFICSLPRGKGYPEHLCSLRFEIQVRTILQHTWASIDHDMGYKSEFGLPRVAVRQFARIAGLLEIADDEFVRVRDTVRAYTDDIRDKIIHDTADDVLVDTVSLQEYLLRSRKMRGFLEELAGICGSEISEVSPESYIGQLRWLNVKNLGQLDELLEENRDTAMRLARKALENTDLDILSSNVGLRFLCRAALLNGGYTQEQAAEFLKLSVEDDARAKRMAASLYRANAEDETL